MLSIKLVFEPESGRDALDPLGDLILTDGERSIVLKTTYLDSWLSALIVASEQIRESQHVTVEVSEEPERIELDRTEGGLVSISYQNQTLRAQSSEVFESALRECSRSFLSAISDLVDYSRNTFLVPIKRFSSGG